MNWYIGQKIVAVKTHESGFFKLGQKFTIKQLRSGVCSCSHALIDIGIGNGEYKFTRCNKHNIWIPDNIGWFGEFNFAPIEEIGDHTIESLLEEIETPQYA